MKVINCFDIKPTVEVPGVLRREVITADDGAPNFVMRVFEVEAGCASPSHTHPFEHEVLVLTGRGVVVSEEGRTPIAKDSVIFVAPNEHHCFVNNGHQTLRFVCLIPLLPEEPV
jgi:quercetin dioxygenase-like cupin family protein